MQIGSLFKYKIIIFIIMFVLPICAADYDRFRGLEIPKQSINMSIRSNNPVEVPIEVKICMVCCAGGCCGCLAECIVAQSLTLSNGPSKNFSSGFVIGAKSMQYLLDQATVAQKINEVGAIVTHHVHNLLYDKID